MYKDIEVTNVILQEAFPAYKSTFRRYYKVTSKYCPTFEAIRQSYEKAHDVDIDYKDPDTESSVISDSC